MTERNYDIEKDMKITELADASTKSSTLRSTRSPSLVSIDPSVLSAIASLADEDPDERNPDERKADLCCGCCCDLIRACIIVDVIFILFALFSLAISYRGFSFVDPNLYDEDMIEEQMAERGAIAAALSRAFMNTDNKNYLFALKSTQVGLGIVFSLVGIVGSCMFQKSLILSTAIWYCISLVMSCVFITLPRAVGQGLFAYPHFALYFALRDGKITGENYDVTEKSCCGRGVAKSSP